MDSLKLSRHELKNSAEEAFIQAQLSAFNERFTGKAERRDLTLVYKDSQDLIVAGLAAYTNWGWLYTRLLWVSDKYQRQGLGGKLMAEAEAEALKRGCKGAWIDTFSLSANKFYQSIGYSVFGKLDHFPGQHTRYFLKKDLE